MLWLALLSRPLGCIYFWASLIMKKEKLKAKSKKTGVKSQRAIGKKKWDKTKTKFIAYLSGGFTQNLVSLVVAVLLRAAGLLRGRVETSPGWLVHANCTRKEHV